MIRPFQGEVTAGACVGALRPGICIASKGHSYLPSGESGCSASWGWGDCVGFLPRRGASARIAERAPTDQTRDSHRIVEPTVGTRLHSLRRICHTARGMDEDWVDWIRRATQYAETCANKFGTESWVVAQRSRKWRWAGKVARMTPDRWAQLATIWEPKDGHRRVGRPSKRWSVDFDEDWLIQAQDVASWNECEDFFC